jgi:hypothetical protein
VLAAHAGLVDHGSGSYRFRWASRAAYEVGVDGPVVAGDVRGAEVLGEGGAEDLGDGEAAALGVVVERGVERRRPFKLTMGLWGIGGAHRGGRRVVAEMWLYSDGSRILELSTKCKPNEAFQVAAETRAYLTRHGVDLSGDQQTKTKAAMEYFAGLLKATEQD